MMDANASKLKSFCRICPGCCGMEIAIDAATGHIAGIHGDHSHRQTMGFACIKGLVAAEAHHGPQRLLRPLKRQPDGSFEPVPLAQAMREIAERVRAILAKHGPDAVAGYRGTLNYLHTTANHMLGDWLRSLGSRSLYSTISIDQSAKWVAIERLGTWGAGTQGFESSDVMMVFGSNPFVTMTTPTFATRNPHKRLKRAKQRGMKLIVVDPRVTETAKQADMVLQLLPGEDVTLAAGMLRIILAENLHDAEFCTRWVNGLDALRTAVAPFDPAYVAARAGIAEDDLVAAARMFATARRGTAVTGTGPDMGPHSNLAEHLIQALNVVCGRFPRAGEPVPNPGVIGPRQPKVAQAVSPSRSFESSPKGTRGIGMLLGERITANLVHEIIEPDQGQVRALFVLGGNPAAAIPDTRRTAAALGSLDLLVAIEPYMSETARLADYVIPPRLQYEHSDITSRVFEGGMFEEPFAQYTPRLLEDPAGSDLCEDWYPLWALMAELGKPFVLDGVELDRNAAPSNDDLIRILTRHGTVPFDEIAAEPGGKVFDVAPQVVEAAPAEAAGRFELMPLDVQSELASALAADGYAQGFAFRLAVRRMRDVQNTMYRNLPTIRARVPYNPANLAASDCARLGLAEGDWVEISSEEGRIAARVRIDADLRPGVVSITHGFGGLDGDGDYEQVGARVNDLISLDRHIETINVMPRMTGIPVNLKPIAAPITDSHEGQSRSRIGQLRM